MASLEELMKNVRLLKNFDVSGRDVEEIILPALNDDSEYVRSNAMHLIKHDLNRDGQFNRDGRYDSSLKDVARSSSDNFVKINALKHLSPDAKRDISGRDVEEIILPALSAPDDVCIWHVRRDAVALLGELNRDGRYDSLLQDVAKSDDHTVVRADALKYLRADTSQPSIQSSIDVEELIQRIIKEIHGQDHDLNIFYAPTEEEFRDKVDEHFRKEGKQTPPGFSYAGCFYSAPLKTCLIHPTVTRNIEEGTNNEFDRLNKLSSFEGVLHEVLHGLIDEAGVRVGTQCLLDLNLQYVDEVRDFISDHLKPLDEYIVSMSAHQLTLDYANQIIGGGMNSNLLYPSLKRKKSLTLEQDKRFGAVFGQVGGTDEEIARYFIARLNSEEGLMEIAKVYLKDPDFIN